MIATLGANIAAVCFRSRLPLEWEFATHTLLGTQEDKDIPPPSYSRICGSIGMVVMAGMFVAVIEFSLYVAFHPATLASLAGTDGTKVPSPIIALLYSLKFFSLAGMSLFRAIWCEQVYGCHH